MSEPYTLVLEDAASRDLKRLDKRIRARVNKRLDWLAANAGKIKHDALAGQWKGLYRLRTSDYRIVYRLDHEE